ncbi:MAG: penicillin-binding transpeptidase domain-containing protein [Lachnospiraceae bacterium]
MKNKTYNKKKVLIVFIGALIIICGLVGRLVYLMIFDATYYQDKAKALHEREREIKAARGEIVDAKGTVLATNKTVCTISVVHSQLTDVEEVVSRLSEELDMEAALVRKKVEKISSVERIKTNVEKEVGDCIREYELDGVKVDEDYKRYYPFDELGSKVLGFTGGDNQGIIGLEVKYEEYLKGQNGLILTTTDARGIELEGIAEDRIEPIKGDTLHLSLDYNVQSYTQQAALKVMQEKQAEKVSVLIMNPQNGEIISMVNVPEFNLNEPFTLNTGMDMSTLGAEEKQESLNQMWRNNCINDTYEPGSTFKIITTAACLEGDVVKLEDQFHCPGYRMVEDRKIRCHKVGGHGTETFVQGIQNSCNPVFIEIGLRLGVDRFYEAYEKFGLLEPTGVDLPGEAQTIMHKKENIGQVELATMTFGQSFQITPMQMATTVSSLLNGGHRITPHLGCSISNAQGKTEKKFHYQSTEDIISKKTSKTLCGLLEGVVAKGSGNKAGIDGYRIGGKTATSQTLPRSANKYISSFIGFAPADNPQVLAMIVIYNPKGIYYGGTIAAPVVKDIFENILPYLGIEKGEIVEKEP